MPFDLITVPCLADNYAFLLHNPDTDETLLVDVPEAEPIQRALSDAGWTLTDILLTHHHDDHVQGLGALRGDARVIAAKADAHRLPALDLAVAEGDALTLCGADAAVFDVSGHTVGHIAVHVPAAHVVFTGDSLMALGCGRLFEGTPAQMWTSMQKLRELPGETTVCSGHEYTQTNARFALTIEPENSDLISRSDAITAARAKDQPTVPSKLAEELRTNPFLRADDADLQKAMGMTGQNAAEVFAAVRKKRDTFQ